MKKLFYIGNYVVCFKPTHTVNSMVWANLLFTCFFIFAHVAYFGHILLWGAIAIIALIICQVLSISLIVFSFFAVFFKVFTLDEYFHICAFSNEFSIKPDGPPDEVIYIQKKHYELLNIIYFSAYCLVKDDNMKVESDMASIKTERITDLNKLIDEYDNDYIEAINELYPYMTGFRIHKSRKV